MENTHFKIQLLTTWFRKHGGRLHPAVEIVDGRDSGGGFHLRARRGHEIQAGTTIIACPHSLTLSVLDLEGADQPWPEEFKLQLKDSPEVLTRFFLIQQISMGPDSFWWPYINLLPSSSGLAPLTPMYYDEADSAWIHGTNLDAARISRLKQWKEEYENAIELLSHCGIFRNRPIERFSWPLYKLAATILTSRCFPGRTFHARISSSNDANAEAQNRAVKKWSAADPSTCPVLLPVFDLANHDPEAKVSWTFGPEHCSLAVEEVIGEGEQIYNNYGPKSNEELIMGYGFSVPANPYNTFAMILNPTAGTAKDTDTLPGNLVPSAKRTVFHLRAEMSPEISLFQHNLPLLTAIAQLVANQREYRQLQFSSVLDVLTARRYPAAHCRLGLLTFSNLQSILSRKLQAINAHDDQLSTNPQNEKQFHALRYRNSQKTILSSHITYLSRRIESAASAETICNLETILTDSPEPLRKQFRAAIHHGLGTRNAAKIRDAGHQELVFTIWLCSLWILRYEEKPDKQDDMVSTFIDGAIPLQKTVSPWLQWLEETYGTPPSWRCNKGTAPGCAQDSVIESGTKENEDDHVVESCFQVIQASSVRYPGSLYNDPRWTVDLLVWGYSIIKEEAFSFPNQSGNEESGEVELLLFLEQSPAPEQRPISD